MAEAVIVAGARTPIGKLSGALAGFTAMDLGGFAIAEALTRAGVSPDQVDYVLMGQVILAGQGQITARQAAVKGGIPMTVPANTINKVCLSGLNTIYLADQMIRAGDAEIVVAGGMESMTQAPYLLPGARAGYRIGDGTLVDSMMYDGLTDSFDHIAMGLSTEQHNAEDRHLPRAPGRLRGGQPREGRRGRQGGPPGRGDRPGAGAPAQGRPAAGRHRRGGAPRHDGRVAGRAQAGLRQERHHHRRERVADLRRRRAVVVMSADKAKELGIAPLGQIVGYGMVAGPDNSLLTQPSRAILKAAGKAGLDLGAIDLFEINEAFAAVGLASVDDLGIDEDKVNVNGGAIALGHPVGMSGTRVALTALLELRRRGAVDCGRGAVRRWRPGRRRHPALPWRRRRAARLSPRRRAAPAAHQLGRPPAATSAQRSTLNV